MGGIQKDSKRIWRINKGINSHHDSGGGGGGEKEEEEEEEGEEEEVGVKDVEVEEEE